MLGFDLKIVFIPFKASQTEEESHLDMDIQ